MSEGDLKNLADLLERFLRVEALAESERLAARRLVVEADRLRVERRTRNDHRREI